MDLTQDILSLSDFKRRSAALVEQMKATKRPLVLTVNGKPELVVQDAASFQRMVTLASRMESVEAIQEGLADMDAGRGDDAETVFARLESKFPFLKRS